MQAHLVCFESTCRAQYDVRDVLYNCPKCGGLLEAAYGPIGADAASLKKLWRERRMDNAPLEQSGVWRYRELFPFLEHAAPPCPEGCGLRWSEGDYLQASGF